MPIYEFFCKDCHTIFNFFSSRPNTEKKPACPSCGKAPLQRLVSLFSTISDKKKNGNSEDNDFSPNLNAVKMEHAISDMLQAAEQMNERDPRQLALLMRRFADQNDLPLHDPMAETLSRLEAGDDPENIEADMEMAADQWNLSFDQETLRKKNRFKAAQPHRDEHLYEL